MRVGLRRRACAACGTILGGAIVAYRIFFHETLPKRFERDSQLHDLHHHWRTSAFAYAASIGHSPMQGGIVPEQAWAYLDIARQNASVVCETGFWQGMSTHLWLLAHGNTTVHSFDVRFPASALHALQGIFGRERLHVHIGPTSSTLARFRPSPKCDILSIDGSHTGWDPYHDLVALLPRTRCGGAIFFDDTFDQREGNRALNNEPSSPLFYNACTRSYWRAVREGLVQHNRCESLGHRMRWGRFPKGYCIARATAYCHP